MRRALRRFSFMLKRWLKAVVDPILGWIAVGLMRAIRRTDRAHTANLAARFMRRVGPWLPEHRTGRANLAAAFPDKSAAEIDEILTGVWDNLGRVAAEFSFLDRMQVHPNDPAPVGTYDERSLAQVGQIRTTNRPTAFFAAHLANWELPALSAARFGIDATVLFRPPNVRTIADAVIKIRAGCMGTMVPSGFDAPLRLAHAIERGGHVAMLVDQHEFRGVDVTFFGRTCKANPLLAQIARHTGCAIRGVRAIRMADGNRFHGEFTEPLDLPRDAQGLVDVQGTMQAITSVIEGWVREHPEQWLWLHRRWR
jgi:KDO2-lipid IV(A) lauroyltransferase